MSVWDDLKDSADARLETDLLPAIYAAASLETEEVRQDLRDAGVPYVDLDHHPSVEELGIAADALIELARRDATAIGAAGGAAGAIGVPPEALASVIHVLRLAQRLCVLYGHDPERGPGYVVMCKTVAAAWQIELPEEMEVRVKDLPSTAAAQLPESKELASWIARKVATRAVWSVLGKGIRWIPGMATGISAYAANRRMKRQGRRMKALLQELATERAPRLLAGPSVEEAEVVEVDP